MHLDVARNFHKKASILKYLDLLAYYKINKFHIHLTDDEGWRLQIKSLPELTEVGGNRGHDASGKGMVPSFASGPFNDPSVSAGSGYYTREDFIEILKYAKARHIEVVPEVDVPGHSRSAIKSMDARFERLMKEGKSGEATKYLLRDLNDQSVYKSVQMWNDNVICICQPSAINFIDEVVKELVSMYKEAGAPITNLHIGADEVPAGVWEKSTVCKQLLDADPNLSTTEELPLYFFRKMSELLAKYNLGVAGWEEVGLKKVGKDHVVNTEFANSKFLPYTWNNVYGWGTEDNAYKLANAGYKVVLSNVTHLYFDLAYDRSPEEPGYYWGGFLNTKKPFEFIPLDMYKSANEDRMGNKIDQSTLSTKERLTEAGKANILGIQGQLWTENTNTQELMEYLTFPKLIGLAERAWAKDPTWASNADEAARNLAIEKEWNVFANTVGQKEFVRLDKFNGGVAYRVSIPGATITNGILTANLDFPGLAIRYTTDGTEPTAKSTLYTAPIAVKGNVKLKAFTTTGRGSRTIEVK
jgi:hexosaminidase